MLTFTARYDGKVLVPQEAVSLPLNVPLLLSIEAQAPSPATEEAPDALRALEGLGAEVWEGIDPVEYQRQERMGWPDPGAKE